MLVRVKLILTNTTVRDTRAPCLEKGIRVLKVAQWVPMSPNGSSHHYRNTYYPLTDFAPPRQVELGFIHRASYTRKCCCVELLLLLLLLQWTSHIATIINHALINSEINTLLIKITLILFKWKRGAKEMSKNLANLHYFFPRVFLLRAYEYHCSFY